MEGKIFVTKFTLSQLFSVHPESEANQELSKIQNNPLKLYSGISGAKNQHLRHLPIPRNCLAVEVQVRNFSLRHERS